MRVFEDFYEVWSKGGGRQGVAPRTDLDDAQRALVEYAEMTVLTADELEIVKVTREVVQ